MKYIIFFSVLGLSTIFLIRSIRDYLELKNGGGKTDWYVSLFMFGALLYLTNRLFAHIVEEFDDPLNIVFRVVLSAFYFAIGYYIFRLYRNVTVTDG